MTHTTRNTRPTRAWQGAALFLVLLLGACKTLDEPDYFAGSINALEGADVTPTTLNTAAQGIPILTRSSMAGIVVNWGEVGREGYSLDPANPPNQSRRLVLLDRSLGAGDWSNTYQALRQSNIVLRAVDRVTGMTDAQKEGIRGWAKTHQALALLTVIVVFDQSGAAIDVDRGVDDPLASIATKAEVYQRIVQLLDQGKTHLLAAGTSFSFTPTPGFAGFNTPATFLRANRAIKARVDVYMQNWTAALQSLSESFVSTSAAMNLGAYNSYSALSGDIVNPLFDPVPRTLVVHPAFVTDAQLRANGTPDLRMTQKTVTIAPRTLNQILVDRRWTVYNSSADPHPIIKNEELILLRAEANLQLTNRAQALADVNVVRVNSGGLAPLAADPGAGGTLTGDLLLDEILYNRRYSLVWEWAHRWIDWRRYGQLAKLPRARPGDVVFPYAPLPDGECIPREPDPPGCTVPAVIP